MKRASAAGSHRRDSGRIGRLLAGIAVAMLLAAAGDGLAVAATGHQAQRVPPGEEVLGPGDHIHICHRLGNGGYNDPYPSVSNVVAPHGHTSHPLDIIPPFNHVNGRFPGLNWTPEGQAIWENGCSRVTPPAGEVRLWPVCVDVHGSTFEARFGYYSTLSIPVGPNNRIASTGAVTGGPVDIAPGEVLTAFAVTGTTGHTVTWTVQPAGQPAVSVSASAEGGFPACTEPPDPGPDGPIGVFVTCVVNHGRTYDAVFGYNSENEDAETIPIGEGANDFSPPPADRGQPTTFEPGLHAEAVVVRGIPSRVRLTWTVAWTDQRSAIASPRFIPKCPSEPSPPAPPTLPPTPPPPPSPQALPIGVFAVCVTNHGSHYDAKFGYVNENPEPVTVPIGSQNAVRPGPAGQGQPETFHPGFADRVFTVKGVSNSHAATWRVSFAGEKRVATATAGFPHKCLTVTPDPVANAAVRKSATPTSVMVGERVRFTIVVRNTGSAVLRPAQVTDTLPASMLQIAAATSTVGSCRVTTGAGSRLVHCTALTLAPGQSLTIHITARATAPGVASDHASVVGLARAVASATVRISGPPPPAVTG